MAGELSRGEKAAVTRQVHAGEEPHLKDGRKQDAVDDYAREVEEKEGGGQPASPRSPKGGHASHARGDLSTGEKAAITKAVHEGRDVANLPFVQDHPKKLEKARAYAEEKK